MKKIFIYTFLLSSLISSWGCEKETYPGAQISPYVAIFDVRNLYRGQDLVLNNDNLKGGHSLAAMVVSDHSGGNLPEGLLVVQDARRLSTLRGISIPLGADATSFVPGDSVIIHIDGKTLSRVNGILEIKGVSKGDIQKVSSDNVIPINRVTIGQMQTNPDAYESVLSVIVKGTFDPLPQPTDVLAGDKTLNDGFGDIILHTEAGAAFANNAAFVNANYFGIAFNSEVKEGQLIPQFRVRTGSDVRELSSQIQVAPVLITGFMSDVAGGDGNYEYVQLMATTDIDFAQTPYAVVVTNNANASTPTGYPSNGWATGNMRTYKFSLSTGTAKKGTFFYVGGAGKLINGSGSTNISSSNWIRAFDYTKNDGDGFGLKTGGLFANSGNASGVAVFKDSAVTASSTPVDVIFIATGGSLYSGNKGYRIASTDFYDIVNPITMAQQPFYRQGSNTLSLVYNTADLGYFNMLGGVYNPALGKWVRARAQNNRLLTKSSPLSDIEGEGATVLK
ncbi:DUF5689 domain-containing protein [Chitinophaga pinensis]|uniref:DUF5689 domain-containing protein n=1 Tax=Chitinophaga pinensis (strain ATCC 43595 / DSM 2588 / LMG 13176 / NBRC 15968 / NCIMB 11800 / UQM 2034) TaxID=485918 RepID=A0A979GRZ6_CHIPD|nr:DUF5689 domain-containing protein [Chitinophaga pinensis]ACU62707.1 hypothetical protein Cpin_5276 [Chitinophaga pinensis DSM 2588]